VLLPHPTQTASLSRKVLQFDPSIGSHGALVIQEVPSHLPRLPLLDGLAAAVQPHSGGASAQTARSGGQQHTSLLGGAVPHASRSPDAAVAAAGRSSAPAAPMQLPAAVEEVPVLDLDVSQLSVLVQNEKSGSSIRHMVYQQQQPSATGSECSWMASSTCSRDGQMAAEQQQQAAWPGHMQQQQQPWGNGHHGAARQSSWLADGGGVLQPFNGPERPRSAALHKPSRQHGKLVAAAGGRSSAAGGRSSAAGIMPVPGNCPEQQQRQSFLTGAPGGGHYAAAYSQQQQHLGQQVVAYDTHELLQRFDESLVDILGEVERLEQQQRLARHALHGHHHQQRQQGRQQQQWHEQENGQAAAAAAAWPLPRGAGEAAFSLDARQQALQERVQLLQREAQLEQQLAAASTAVTGARRGAAAAAWVAQQHQQYEQQQSWLLSHGGYSTSRDFLDDDEVSDILNQLD
jgi:hypothetical protein